MSELLATDWFVWGVGLILGFQVLVVLLGEAIYRAERRTLPIGGIFRALRNVVLPLVVLFLFLTRLLEIDRQSVLGRIAETALWTSIVYAGLLVLNVLVFENAPQGTWRSRAPKLFQDLMRVLLIAVGAAIVLSVVWRQDLGGLIAALGVGSIVLGLALQETLGNLMAGIALFFERPFSVGDWISVGGRSGAVVQMTWRSVHVRTAERNLLVLPNAALGRETIINYSRPSQQQTVRLSFGFGLDAAPNRVKAMLLEVARQIPHALADPKPRAVACEVLTDRIRYEASVTIEHGRFLPQVVDAFTSAVWYAAQRAGMPLPLPRAVELQIDADTVATGARDTVHAQLHRAEGFRVLPDPAVTSLAAQADTVLFGARELMLEAGEVPQWVYVVTSGEALGTQRLDEGDEGSLRFGVGDVLGVTSLARAQASEMRVVAATDLSAVRLPATVVARALQDHPALANQFARIWQARTEIMRRSGTQTALNDTAPADHSAEQDSER
jgi:small-conductance mechanosensitive channel/CRP-like cAMP-binding protein